MKHFKESLNQNTYTKYPLKQFFKKHNQEQFLILDQVDDFSVMYDVVLVSQRLMLLEESSFCPPCCRPEWGFLLIFPSPSRQTPLGEKGNEFLL